MMTYKGYIGDVEYDDRAKIFHGGVVNSRDVITFQGNSGEELEQAFHDSVDDYVARCAEEVSLVAFDSWFFEFRERFADVMGAPRIEC